MTHQAWVTTIIASALIVAIVPVFAGLAALLPSSPDTVSLVWAATALLVAGAVVAMIVRTRRRHA